MKSNAICKYVRFPKPYSVYSSPRDSRRFSFKIRVLYIHTMLAIYILEYPQSRARPASDPGKYGMDGPTVQCFASEKSMRNESTCMHQKSPKCCLCTPLHSAHFFSDGENTYHIAWRVLHVQKSHPAAEYSQVDFQLITITISSLVINHVCEIGS